MLCMHNHVLKAVQKHNTKRSWIPCAHRGPVSNAEISIQSAVQQNVEGLQGNDCRLKKWYREWQRTSDERRTVNTHGGRIGDL